MAKIILEEQPDYPTLPDDSIVFLKVDEVVDKEIQGRSGTWTKLEFKFKILGIQVVGDGSPLECYDSLIGEHIYGSVPFRLTDSPENKLRIWAEALLDMDLGVGFELDTDYFKGRDVRGITSTYEKRAINPSTGKPFRAHQVATLLKKGGIAPPTQGVGGWATAPAATQPQLAAAQYDDPWAPATAAAAAPATSTAWSDEPPF